MLKRERRQSFRVPVQAPISLRTDDAEHIEGILLDVSSGGIDVLAAKPLPSAALAHFSFELPDVNVQVGRRRGSSLEQRQWPDRHCASWTWTCRMREQLERMARLSLAGSTCPKSPKRSRIAN